MQWDWEYFFNIKKNSYCNSIRVNSRLVPRLAVLWCKKLDMGSQSAPVCPSQIPQIPKSNPVRARMGWPMQIPYGFQAGYAWAQRAWYGYMPIQIPVRAPLKSMCKPGQITDVAQTQWARNGQTGLAGSNPVWARAGLAIWAELK